MTYEEVVSRFEVKKPGRDQVQCICPAHRDKEASLTIGRGDRGTVLHCHAGCETADIVKAVGLSMRDLFYKDNAATVEKWRGYVEGREKRQIEDVYPYVDLSGRYAFTRLRLSGKKFIYGIVNGDRFNYGLNGKHRKDIPAVYCGSLTGLQKAVDAGEVVFYCEGEKDVKTVNSHGLTGVTCGASGDWVQGCATLFEGADVVILQDNDDAGRKSARAIAKDLKPVAKRVRIIVPTPDIEHGDVSDFFRDHDVSDLMDLIGKTDLDRFHVKNKNGEVTGVFDYAIFDHIRTTQPMFVLGGVPYIYNGGVFRPDRSGAELKTMIRSLIYPVYVKSTTIKRIFDLFMGDAGLQVSPDDLNAYPPEWICFRNGFYDPVGKKMIQHDPKYRAVNQIPHDFNPDANLWSDDVVDWLDFICDSPDESEMLLQYCGYCMTRDTRQQKFLILNGEGGSGKSTVIRMIERVIGTENTSNVSLTQLTQRFAAYGLMGKLLNSCADLEVEALGDTSTLKKLLGEDVLSAEAKGKDAVSFRNYAKLIFSTNELPIVKGERTNGFYRRLLILTMDKVPKVKETDYFDRLSRGIDFFIWITVKALERMYDEGRITESQESKDAVARLRCDSDTVEAFLRDMVMVSKDGRTKKPALFRGYEEYCCEMERTPLTKSNFYKAMRVKGYGIIKTGGVEYFRGVIYP